MPESRSYSAARAPPRKDNTPGINNQAFCPKIAKGQNNKLEFAIFIVKNILSGIMALHDKGYIHRDLDPSNIMITADRKVKIIDFGIAKKLDSLNTQDQQLTNTGQFVGKAAYGAPEILLRSKALGVQLKL